MLDKKFKKEWITALRSGKYTQAQEALFDGTGYCCLGVACDIGIDGEWEYEEGDGWYLMPDNPHYTGDDSVLPMWFREKIGLSGQAQSDLICMNDNGENFAHIANYIEEML